LSVKEKVGDLLFDEVVGTVALLFAGVVVSNYQPDGNYNQFYLFSSSNYFPNYDALPPTGKVRSRVSPDINQVTMLALGYFIACLKELKGKINDFVG
jgi:hypothetical protein